jgi:hypothetical protein
MDKQFRLAALTVLSSMVVTACGGGDSSPESSPAPPSENVTAAQTTANQNPMCTAIQPFYWEVGDKNGVPLASGSVGDNAPIRTESMAIASASKWLYASYAVQKLGGVANLDPVLDVPFLNFTSGYTWSTSAGPGICDKDGTVQACNTLNNSSQDPSLVGTFHYDSGHMEYHAMARAGLGADGNDALAAAVLGTDTGSADPDANTYTQPLLAGGVATSAASYATFLANILSGNLAMLDVLKNDASSAPSYKVATTGGNTSSPLADATNALGQTEKWNYSLGHWVEDDPTWGDHAFSSAGAFGFYPWIDKSLTYYGIIARRSPPTEEQYDGFQSAQCGRLIRQAWLSGVSVPSETVPTPASD